LRLFISIVVFGRLADGREGEEEEEEEEEEEGRRDRARAPHCKGGTPLLFAAFH
jgi:hypothetical protein